MAKSYADLEKDVEEAGRALQNAYTQVKSMSALIGVLLEQRTSGSYEILRKELENNFNAFDVIVDAEEEYITISLKPKAK